MPTDYDLPLRPSELQRIQELLAIVEGATTELKDELVRIRARSYEKKADRLWRSKKSRLG